MADFFFKEMLSGFDARGSFSCPCGKAHRIAIREVLVGEDAILGSAELLMRLYGAGPSLWILSDENTERAAGEGLKSRVRASRLKSRILPGSPKPVPTLELANELSSEVRAFSPTLLVSVGSGVISDLVKKVSLDTGVPNWCVATAPSVDAYSSATSAIRVSGYHEALPTGISEVIVCDLGVILHSPRRLFMAGLGDLLAKFIAHLDWNLAHIVTGEHYCPTMAGFALGSARKALEAARELDGDPLEAARTLTDAVLVSGFAMQALDGSRPAASAEHTIAHLWEMAGIVGREEFDLHGILVGAASRLVLGGYSTFYAGLEGFSPDVGARLSSYDAEPGWEAGLEPGLQRFKAKIAAEMRARVFDRSELKRRLEACGRERDRILRIAGPLIAELGGAVRLLESLEFPFSLRELEVPAPYGPMAAHNVRLLRNRYTTFDLAYELGREGELFKGISERE